MCLFRTPSPLSLTLFSAPNALNLGRMKNRAQQACNPHFTPRLELIKEADVKAKEVSEGVREKRAAVLAE